MNAGWKQAKKQHGELVVAGKQRFGDDVSSAPQADQAPAPVAAPLPIAGLVLTQSWVKQHAPEIVELRVEAENTPNGGELRHVRARMTGPELRRLPELLVSGPSALELKAELVEAWAVAFEARWGQARAVAAGVRDAVPHTRENVERIAQVRDDMELVAREAGIRLKVLPQSTAAQHSLSLGEKLRKWIPERPA